MPHSGETTRWMPHSGENDAVPKFSYAFIARMTIHYRYGTIFPNTPNNKDAGFRAGRAAVTDPGAGSIAFPASWSVSGLVPYPSQQALRSIVVECWTTTAVRCRLILIRRAMADRSSGRVHTAEDTIDAEKFRELANLIGEILSALELSADQRDHLKVGAAEIRAVACDPNTKPEALRQAIEGVLRLLGRQFHKRGGESTVGEKVTIAPPAPPIGY